MLDTHIGHNEIARFADKQVNLKRDDVSDFRQQVNRLRDKLKKHIDDNPGFDLVKMLHSGSVAKGTALKTLNDMDVAVYVTAGKAPEQEAELLNWTAERLRDAYGQTLNPDQIQPGHHCVTVNFRGSGLDVDVVPVVYEGDSSDRGYLIPADSGQRVLTSIPMHLDFIRKRKAANENSYAQMVRLIKWWARIQKNTRNGFRFKSFMAEMLLAHMFDKGFDADNYAEALFQFFSYIDTSRLQEIIIFTDYYSKSSVTSDNCPVQIYDPVNPENNICSMYSQSDVDTILEAAEDALDAIAYARRASTKSEAVSAWQDIFGTSFKGD